MGFSISPHSPESYSLTLLVHAPKLVNVLVGVFIVGIGAVFPLIYSGNYPQ